MAGETVIEWPGFDQPRTIENMENAIREWVLGVTGLPDRAVYWADQDAPKAAPPWITLRIGPSVAVGWNAEVIETFDATRPFNEEIEQTARVLSEFTLTLQCGTKATHGSFSARAILAQLGATLGLPRWRDSLSHAGAVPFDVGPAVNLSAVLQTDFTGRAALDVRFYATQTATARVGYIGRATITDTTTEPERSITLDLP